MDRNSGRLVALPNVSGAWDSVARGTGLLSTLQRGRSGWEIINQSHLASLAQTPAAVHAVISRAESDLETFWSRRAALPERLLTFAADTADGFDISIFLSNTAISGYFGEMEQNFETVAEAMVWVRRGLSDHYRLRTVAIGGVASEWWLEPKNGSSTTTDMLVSGRLRLFRSWRSRSEVLRYNRVLGIS